MPTWDSQANDIFLSALELPAHQRQAYLDEACNGDGDVRRRVESLLQAATQAGSFFDIPAVDLAATVDCGSLETIGSQIGPYTLLQQIGEGGFGIVYMAEQHAPLRRKVALKILKPGMDTRQVIARFEAERQALALMDHPHIARVIDAGATSTGRPYFVMELVRGRKITEFCDEQRLDIRQRLELFITVCQAVQHAHQKGIIHRDLKPSNVLVTLHDGQPVAKVIDFGIAKAIGQQLTDKTLFTQFEQMIGTPLYMSPEQAELSGLDIDTRSDVYSLGVLLYELLTGATPFDGETLRKAGFDELRRIIREDEPPRPSHRLSTLNAMEVSTISQQRGADQNRLRQVVRGELDWIVMKSLEKERTRRYESASAFARDVQHFLNDEPVAACPPSTSYRVRKLIRRRKLAFALGSFVGTLLLATAIGGSVLAAWALEAEKLARTNEQAATEEARKAASVLNFLQNDVFGAAKSGLEGRQVTFLSAINEAELKISQAFADQPLVEASIRTMLGQLYRSMDEPERAIAEHQRALDIRRRELGDGHPLTMEVMHWLAVDYKITGDFETAIKLFSDTFALRRAHLPGHHPDTIQTMANLAGTHELLSQQADKNPLKESTALSRKSLLGSAMVADARRLKDSNRPLPDKPLAEVEALLGGARFDRFRREQAAVEVENEIKVNKMLASAETLLIGAYEGLKSRKEENVELTNALGRLIELYEVWDKPEEASKWRLEFSRRKAENDSTSQSTINAN